MPWRLIRCHSDTLSLDAGWGEASPQRRYFALRAQYASPPSGITQKHINSSQTPTSPPAPLPLGEGSMLHKKQKGLTQTHKKASLSQRPKPHHLMKCERAARHRRVALSHFGGCGGTGPPTQKEPYPMVCAMRWLISVRTSCALPCAWAVSLMRWAWTWTVRARTSSGRTMERWWKRALARAALR